MKLSQWAKKRGITYKMAWRWVKEGKMPVTFEITPSGTILVHEPEAPKAGIVALYARVSSSDQKADLERQVVRLLEFANARGLSVGKTVKEGSRFRSERQAEGAHQAPLRPERNDHRRGTSGSADAFWL